MAPIVEHFAPVARSEGGEKMWAHLHEGGVDMAAWRDGRLLHAGTWACKPGADAAYYLLFAWRALRLDSAQGELSEWNGAYAPGGDDHAPPPHKLCGPDGY